MVVLPQRETFSCLFLREGEEGEERGKGGDGALDLRGAGIQRSVGWPEVRQSGGAMSAVLARGRRFRAVPALLRLRPCAASEAQEPRCRRFALRARSAFAPA